MKQWKRAKRIMSDDEIIDSILNPTEWRDKLQKERNAAKQAAIDVKPDYSQSNLEPSEIKRTKFKYTPVDYSRGRDAMTEDEIIDSVLHPSKKINRKHESLADLRLDVSPEVKEQWLEKVKQAELKRGKAFKKLCE